MTEHKIGSREEWQAAREMLLQREKEHPDGRRLSLETPAAATLQP